MKLEQIIQNKWCQLRMLLFIIALQLFCIPAFAQVAVKITGTVTDENAAVLSSVNVSLKESKLSTSTNTQGKYEIIIPNGQGILVFEFVGYARREIPIPTGKILNVRLEKETKGLDEVVVVGYGTQKKGDLTGSIVSLSEKDFKNYAVPNVSQLLQGKAAGVYVATNSGQPGDAAVIRIRGFGTVNDNNPLYVVDGQLFNNINNVNPNDIQNIEVLKDASATAIYGSRGSNGVILVTTKKAKQGQSITSFDSYVGAKMSYNAPKMQNSEQYFNYIKTAYENSGQVVDPKFQMQYERGYDTDWWKEVNQTGLSQNYNFNVKNGSEKSRSYFSLGYLNDKGAIITTNFTRISLKFNNEYDLSSRITVGLNMGLAKNKTRDTGALPYFSQILLPDPFTPVINPNVAVGSPNYIYDKYAPPEWGYTPNPVATLMINERSSDDFNAYGNVFGKLKLTDDLNYFVQYNFENGNNRFKSFNPIFHAQFSYLNLANQENKYNDQTQLTNNSYNSVRNVIEQRLNYVKTFGKSNLDAMVAMTYDANNSESINGYKTNAPGNDVAFRVLDGATLGAQVSGGRVETAILSYLSRLNYSFDDRYFLTMNFRADGSSVFSEGNKWGYFPSFSLGWKINHEAFFKQMGIDKVVSNLKLRGGWGQTGNQNINSYAPITLIGTNNNNQWNFGTGYSQGYVPTNIGNPNIKWETSQQTNIGLDAGFLNDDLSFSLDYFIKKTSDMLLQVPLPAISGYPNYPYSNAGNVTNKGFEMSTNYRSSIGQVNIALGANLSFYKNQVTSLGNGGIPLYGAVSKTEVGGPMSRFFGYVWEGIFQNEQEINAYAGPNGQKIQPYAQPGDFKFADLNHDGQIDDKDRKYIGNPHPDLIYGFNLNFDYKGFDLGAFFQGTIGNDIWNGIKTLSSPITQNALADAYTKAWFKEGDKASYPKISLRNDNNNLRASDWWVESGSFLRLQNLQLGYSLPAKFLQRSKLLSTCRFYLSGQNLLTLTGYSGMDPEIGAAGALNLGYDGIRYPSSRTLILGINAQF